MTLTQYHIFKAFGHFSLVPTTIGRKLKNIGRDGSILWKKGEPNGSRPETLLGAAGISLKMTSCATSPLMTRRVRSSSSHRLKRDELGISVFPTVHAKAVNQTPVLSDSGKCNQEWQVRIVIVCSYDLRDLSLLHVCKPLKTYWSNKKTCFN